MPHPIITPSRINPSRINPSRRQVLGASAAAAATLTIPRVHAASGDGEIRLALIGCGGRGTGAANDAIKASPVPVKLVAMADVFENKLENSFRALTNENVDNPKSIDVPKERRFVGFDGYRGAMDALRPGDIAIFASPLAFRWVHFQYAIEKGLNVFMEKPVVADGPTGRRMLELSAAADAKGLKCAVGLMVRHCRARQALLSQIRDGAIGDIVAMRAYRMHGPVASAFSKRKPDDVSETMYQIDRFHSFLWASGGCFSDFYIHQIDETSWMKGDWPVSAHGLGGRHYRGDYVDQNFDTYHVEYTYPDGSKLFFDGRCMNGCRNNMSSVVHGAKAAAVVSESGHTPGRVKIYKSQEQNRRNIAWQYGYKEESPYRLEWEDLIEAIIRNQPYNEVPRGVRASLVTSMGRMAAHTGQQITYDQMLGCEHEFAPDVDRLTADGPAPLTPLPDGSYPVPQPGIVRDREYQPYVPERVEPSETRPAADTKPDTKDAIGADATSDAGVTTVDTPKTQTTSDASGASAKSSAKP